MVAKLCANLSIDTSNRLFFFTAESKLQEPQDHRTLYERLQEQKNIKEELFKESTRLSNLIKRIDDDDADYYHTLADTQKRLEEEIQQKEREELEAYRKFVIIPFPK